MYSFVIQRITWKNVLGFIFLENLLSVTWTNVFGIDFAIISGQSVISDSFAHPLWCTNRNTCNIVQSWPTICDKFAQCPPRRCPLLQISHLNNALVSFSFGPGEERARTGRGTGEAGRGTGEEQARNGRGTGECKGARGEGGKRSCLEGVNA